MKRILSVILLCLLPSLALAQTAQTRAQLYQNTAPYSGVISNIIASMASLSDTSNIFTGNITAQGQVFIEAGFYFTGNLPTLTACGTNPAVTAHSGQAGEITFGTGSPTACTMTFNAGTLFTHDSFCQFTPGSSATAAISGGYWVSAHSATAVTLTLGAATNSAVFEYVCFGN